MPKRKVAYIIRRTGYAAEERKYCQVRRKGFKDMCGNNSGLWIIIILIILFSCGGCGNWGGCCDNGCGNNCGNNCC